jgi:hypothetical protein
MVSKFGDLPFCLLVVKPNRDVSAPVIPAPVFFKNSLLSIDFPPVYMEGLGPTFIYHSKRERSKERYVQAPAKRLQHGKA